MTLLDRVGVDPTWCVDEPAMVAGPWSAFRRTVPARTVTLVEPEAIPAGEQTGSVEVHESTYGTFTVEQWQHGELGGVRHGRTGNRILWSAGCAHFFVERSPLPVQAWVHARFVLRHVIVSTLLVQGADCLHGLGVRALAGESAGVVVAGATLTGKTRLANRLLDRGVLEEIVEDDCAVLSAGGTVLSLIPTQHELRRRTALDLAAVVELTDAVTAVEPAPAAAVRNSLAATPLSWPTGWLPGPARRPTIAGIADATPCLRVPARRDDDETVDAVADFLGDVL